MSKMQSAAVPSPLIDAIGENGGRCDRRHLTRAVALLQDAAGVPVSLGSGGDREPATSCGPSFSEQLTAEFAAMRSDCLLTAAPGGRFHDSIATTDRSLRNRPCHPLTTGTLELRATPKAERDIREQGPKSQEALASGRTQAAALSERQIL